MVSVHRRVVACYGDILGNAYAVCDEFFRQFDCGNVVAADHRFGTFKFAAYYPVGKTLCSAFPEVAVLIVASVKIQSVFFHGVHVSAQALLGIKDLFRACKTVYLLFAVNRNEVIGDSFKCVTVVNGSGLKAFVTAVIEQHYGFSCAAAKIVDMFLDIVTVEGETVVDEAVKLL